MIADGNVQRKWSDVARLVLFGCIAGSIGLAVVDALLHTPSVAEPATGAILGFRTLVIDFHFLCDQGVYAAIILLVGAKFFETRTVITIAFDKLDAAKMHLKGPDSDNIVWVGRKYGSAIEAEAVSAAMQSRLQESAN